MLEIKGIVVIAFNPTLYLVQLVLVGELKIKKVVYSLQDRGEEECPPNVDPGM